MNKTGLLEKRNTIYGFCAIWILLFHIYRNTSVPAVPVISNLLRLGNLGVDIFLYLSGLSLCVSAAKRQYSGKKWMDFFRRRSIRVLLPYLIVAIPHFCWAAVCEHSGGLLRRIVLFFSDLFFATFCLKGTQTIWFVFGILICYLLFPLLYRFAKNASRLKKWMLLLLIVGFAFLAAFLPFLHNLEIIWARLPIFTIGVFYGVETEKAKSYYKPSLLMYFLAFAVVVVCGWVVSTNRIPSHSDEWLLIRWLVYVPMTIAFLVLVSNLGKRVQIIEYVGGLSLEIYLVHITILHPFRYYGLLKHLGGWTYLVLPLYTIPVAWVVRWLGKQIVKSREV